ncbi:MAG: shikimate dehydrogenase [Clostridiales bacterium]|nr:shikimate dehydrogenase [Clostridiales bacterium]
MKHYALIGEKLGHSLSVPIHEAIFQRLGIDADYRLIEIPRDDFAPTVRRLIAELDGFNVTIPYKQDVMPLLDAIDPAAQAIGAVNTVVKGARVCGHNTDILGFTAMLRHYGIDPLDQPCYVLGGGGTAKTACAALMRMGAKSVTVVSRHPGPGQIDYQRLTEDFSGILVNTTPAGMLYQKDPCPIDEAALPGILARAKGVVDVIYNPPETVLTAAARAAGIPACTGLYMLIGQAVAAESLWQGLPMPDDLTETLMKELTLL